MIFSESIFFMFYSSGCLSCFSYRQSFPPRNLTSKSISSCIKINRFINRFPKPLSNFAGKAAAQSLRYEISSHFNFLFSFQNELDDLIASECLYCGEIMIR